MSNAVKFFIIHYTVTNANVNPGSKSVSQWFSGRV